MLIQKNFHCPAVDAPVILYRQTYYVSGIGAPSPTPQHDYDCSRANNCQHRYTEACRVQSLNQ